MKKIIQEYLQECINFGVKKFDLKYKIIKTLNEDCPATLKREIGRAHV